jgi:hypothetical protein
MNNFERFLTFSCNKIVNDDGFLYSFSDGEIEFLPSDSELRILITFEGQIEAGYDQYEWVELVVETTETFPEDVKLPEIIKWLKSKIK